MLIYHDYLNNLIKSENKWAEGLKERVLVVDNLTEYAKSLQWSYRVTLPISQLFTQTRQILDYLTYENDCENKYDISVIKSISQLLNKISKRIRVVLNSLDKEEVKYNECNRVYINQFNIEQERLFTLFKKLKKELTRLMKLPIIRVNHSDTMLKKMTCFYQLNQQLNSILNPTADMTYWYVEGEWIETDFYHLHFNSVPLILDHSQTDYLSMFKSSYLFSPGDYHFRQLSGSAAILNLDVFNYVSLPKRTMTEVEKVKVPIEFLPELSRRKEKDLHERQALSVESLINNQLIDQSSHILVICNSKQAIKQTYIKLSNQQHMVKKYAILAEGMSGSLAKMHRRVLESDASIVIIHHHSLIYGHFKTVHSQLQVIVQQLPFLSPNNIQIQAMADYFIEDQEKLFDVILLPKMIQSLRELFTYLKQHVDFDSIYLLDGRIFDKYYSHQVREELKEIVNFEIKG